MNYRMVTRHAEAKDGTRIAHHTHLPGGADGAADQAMRERRPVLLTSGIGTTSNFWRFLIERLTLEHRVVHWDYRGHGLSESSRSGSYRFELLVDDLEAVIEEVVASGASEKPPLHVGFSMGVPVLLDAYRRKPELFPALVLIAGAAQAPGTGTLPFRIPGAMKATRLALDLLTPAVPTLAPAVHRLLSSQWIYPAGRVTGLLRRRAPKEDIDHFMRELCRMDPLAFWQTLRSLMRVDATSVLPTVKVPVLIIAPENDLMIAPSQVEALRQGIPHAEYLLVKDAGHATLLEAGSEVSEAIAAFLRKVP